MKLKDLVNRKIGYGIVQPGASCDDGVPVIKAGNIIEGLNDVSRLDTTVPENDVKYKRTKLQGGELVVTVVGTVGKTAIVPNSFAGCNLVRATALIDIMDKIDALWVKYYIDSPEGQNYIEQNLNTTVQPTLNIKSLADMDIQMPDKEIRGKIVGLLDNIDSKIRTNENINRNLSDQLETVFAERFLSLDWNGDLPEGWKLTKLKDVAQFSQGVQVPVEEQLSNYEEGYERFIRIVDITQGNEKDIRYIEDRQRGHVEENEIFMIRYGTPGILSWNYRGIIANNLFKISSTTEEVTYNYLYSLLKTERVLGYLKGNAVSSTMPAINFSTLNGIDILIPDKKSMQDFSEFSETIRIHQLELINENYSLTHLRDSLLPKLMNGEISVEDLEM